MDFDGETLHFLQLTEFMILSLKLSSSNSAYSACLKSHLVVRIKERKNACLVHLLECSQDSNFVMENKLDMFGKYGETKTRCPLLQQS